MLLPLGVKILWFGLSLTGLAGCWIVSLALGRTIGALWPPILYCVGCSLLEGIVCIGIFWRMDPFAMPGRFCTAQSIFISLGGLIMTGVICTISYMTNMIVGKPKTWGERSNSALSWRHIYAFPILGFPMVALAIHLSLILKLGAVHPAVELYCDSSSPQWIHFVSYAGMPLFLSLPALVLSVKTILRVQEINRHIQRARTSEIDMEPSEDVYTHPLRIFSSKRLRSKVLRTKRTLDLDDDNSDQKSQTDTSPAPSLRFISSAFSRNDPRRSANNAPHLNGVSGDVIQAVHPSMGVHFHIPIKPPSGDTERGQMTSETSLPDTDSPSVSSFPRLTVYSTTPNHPDSDATIAEVGRHSLSFDSHQRHHIDISGGCDDDRASVRDEKRKHDSWIDVIEMVNAKQDDDREGGEWRDNSAYSDTTGAGDDKKGLEFEGDNNVLSEETKARALPKQRTHTKHFNNDSVLPPPFFRNRRPPPPSLSRAIWRIILFQITFIFVQTLGGLSTLIDVARHSPPTPLGTHHFAILFIVWGPVFFFGSLPSVRQNVIFLRSHSVP